MALMDEALADLIKSNEALVSKLNDGTATRDDHRALDATMTEIERRTTECSALATMTRAELMKRNESLMAKMEAGTATRADAERLKNTMAAIAAEDQERTAIKLEASTMDTKSLMERNAELMRKLSAGTATRAEATKLKANTAAVEKAKADADAKRTPTIRLTERKTASRDVMQMIKESERTDLCFMVDATGSMGRHIEAVKMQIAKIAKDVQKTNPHLQLRVAITGYRDALEGDGGNSPFDFTDSLETFESNVSSIRLVCNGDVCEDVSSGFSDVLRFSWSSPTRVLFFIADAPSHGARYHDGCDDNHTSGDHGIPDKLKQLVAMNVDIVFCSINDSTSKMIRVMNSDLGGSPIKTVPLSDPSTLTKHATETLRTSMQRTLTKISSTSVSARKAKAPAKSRPEWCPVARPLTFRRPISS